MIHRNSSTTTPMTEPVEAGHSLGGDAWHRLQKNRLAVASLIFISVLGLASLLAPWIAPESYEKQNLALGAIPPSSNHWLGTDALGRDLLSRILYGGRVSMAAGLCATAVSLTIGVFYGTISGYVGGRLDVVMMRLGDLLFLPPLSTLLS